jgi:hypothetical protein
MSKPDRPATDLSRLAMLYAGGELNEVDAAAFERRLADDQSTRDALCVAVRLRRLLNGQPALTPSPEYRERVRQRLRASNAQRRAASRFGSRWQKAMWSLTGAAAAASLLVAIGLGVRHGYQTAAEQPATSEETASQPVDPCERCDDCEDVPELIGGRRLADAVNEENRRKERAEERRIVVRGEERAARLRGAPVYRQ